MTKWNFTSVRFVLFLFEKQICGYEFTGKLARMFQDIKVSEDLNTEFLEYLKTESPSNHQNQPMTSFIGLDFNVNVLQVREKSSYLKKQSENVFVSDEFVAISTANSE